MNTTLKILLMFTILSFLTACTQSNANESSTQFSSPPIKDILDGKTTMQFETKEYDFGAVREGEKLRHEFCFQNTGNAPLIIEDIKWGCSCTIAAHPRKPIFMGERSQISVEVDTKGLTGKQLKTIHVHTNTPDSPTYLHIKTEVIKSNGALF